MRIVFYTIYIFLQCYFNPHHHKAFNRVILGFNLRTYTGAAKDRIFIGDIANKAKELTNVSQLRNDNKGRYLPASALSLLYASKNIKRKKYKLKYLL